MKPNKGFITVFMMVLISICRYGRYGNELIRLGIFTNGGLSH